MLDQAAVFGAEFDADLLATAHGAPLLDVLETLETAEAAGLVQPHPRRPAGFAFVHALFRSHRYRALPVRRRLELHAKAATALATRPADERLLAERARHACLALPVGDAELAVDLSREAAPPNERAYAYDEAVAHDRRRPGRGARLSTHRIPRRWGVGAQAPTVSGVVVPLTVLVMPSRAAPTTRTAHP